MTKKEFTTLVDSFCTDNELTEKERVELEDRIADIQRIHRNKGFRAKDSYEIIGTHIARV